MNVLAWIFLGIVAIGATYLALTTTDNEFAILTGVVGGLSWLLFAFYALDVTPVTGGTAERYPAMVAWGLACAAPNLYVALTGPLNVVQDRAELQGEVQ